MEPATIFFVGVLVGIGATSLWSRATQH